MQVNTPRSSTLLVYLTVRQFVMTNSFLVNLNFKKFFEQPTNFFDKFSKNVFDTWNTLTVVHRMKVEQKNRF